MTEEELVENNAFLNAVIETAPMKYAYKYVQQLLVSFASVDMRAVALLLVLVLVS